MNDKTLKTLEFDKILLQLESYASSVLGEEKIRGLRPISSFEQVVQRQSETDGQMKLHMFFV